MADQSYPITAQTLPSGFCPTTWQSILNTFSANQFVTIPIENSQLIVSATKPAPEFEGNAAWLQLNSAGYGQNIYWFANGAWFSKHPMPVGFIGIWEGDPSTIATYDGGEAGSPTLISGPMWEIVSQLAGKFPLGAGTLGDSGTVISPGDTGGHDQATIGAASMPKHTHDCRATSQSGSGGFGHEFFQANETSKDPPDNAVTLTTESAGGDGSGATTPVNIINPYYGVSFIRRTIRQYLRVD